mmetsp:Transcript_49893/g.139640  ORF Transcript_49893/g.139640 Transcript_49893/m.139640 type:complete len:230 (-) Transcript_49893:2780-3469(-)
MPRSLSGRARASLAPHRSRSTESRRPQGHAIIRGVAPLGPCASRRSGRARSFRGRLQCGRATRLFSTRSSMPQTTVTSESSPFFATMSVQWPTGMPSASLPMALPGAGSLTPWSRWRLRQWKSCEGAPWSWQDREFERRSLCRWCRSADQRCATCCQVTRSRQSSLRQGQALAQRCQGPLRGTSTLVPPGPLRNLVRRASPRPSAWRRPRAIMAKAENAAFPRMRLFTS